MNSWLVIISKGCRLFYSKKRAKKTPNEKSFGVF